LVRRGRRLAMIRWWRVVAVALCRALPGGVVPRRPADRERVSISLPVSDVHGSGPEGLRGLREEKYNVNLKTSACRRARLVCVRTDLEWKGKPRPTSLRARGDALRSAGRPGPPGQGDPSPRRCGTRPGHDRRSRRAPLKIPRDSGGNDLEPYGLIYQPKLLQRLGSSSRIGMICSTQAQGPIAQCTAGPVELEPREL